MGFKEKIKIKDVIEMDSVKKTAKYFLYNSPDMFEEQKDIYINASKEDPANVSLSNGINRLIDLSQAGEYMYSVYAENECKEDPQMRDVNIIHFPAYDTEGAKGRPFILICAGGAYFNVWSFTEGYSVAARYNELGYNAFVLTYRTGEEGLFPKPMDDVAAALKYIMNRKDTFDLGSDRYIVCGFSAGGNLTCQWGTKINGYKAYGLSRPEALFPIYPVVSFEKFMYDELFQEMAKVTMGKNISKECFKRYEVLEHIDKEYPPVFTAFCLDDDLVSPENSLLLKKKLEENMVPCRFMAGNTGGHGFGEGTHCDCAGWVEKSIEFFTMLQNQ